MMFTFQPRKSASENWLMRVLLILRSPGILSPSDNAYIVENESLRDCLRFIVSGSLWVCIPGMIVSPRTFSSFGKYLIFEPLRLMSLATENNFGSFLI